jgi:hypothetical protein
MLDELSKNKRRAFYEVEGARVGGDSRTVIVSGLPSASRAACAIVWSVGVEP